MPTQLGPGWETFHRIIGFARQARVPWASNLMIRGSSLRIVGHPYVEIRQLAYTHANDNEKRE